MKMRLWFFCITCICVALQNENLDKIYEPNQNNLISLKTTPKKILERDFTGKGRKFTTKSRLNVSQTSQIVNDLHQDSVKRKRDLVGDELQANEMKPSNDDQNAMYKENMETENSFESMPIINDEFQTPELLNEKSDDIIYKENENNMRDDAENVINPGVNPLLDQKTYYQEVKKRVDLAVQNGIKERQEEENGEIEMDSSRHQEALRKGNEMKNPCVVSPCQNGGTCSMGPGEESETFSCECKIGFHGKLCEQNVEECAKSPCKDRGACVATKHGFICLCKDGFGGRYCEILDKNGIDPNSDNVEETEVDFVVSNTGIRILFLSGVIVGPLTCLVCLFVCIHCCRVYNKREKILQAMREKLDEGEGLTELPPGICDVSRDLCRHACTCCACTCNQNNETLYKKLVDELWCELRKSGTDSSARGRVTRHLLRSPSRRLLDSRQVVSDPVLPCERPSIDSFRSLPALPSTHRTYSWAPEMPSIEEENESPGTHLLKHHRSPSSPLLASSQRSNRRPSSRKLFDDVIEEEEGDFSLTNHAPSIPKSGTGHVISGHLDYTKNLRMPSTRVPTILSMVHRNSLQPPRQSNDDDDGGDDDDGFGDELEEQLLSKNVFSPSVARKSSRDHFNDLSQKLLRSGQGMDFNSEDRMKSPSHKHTPPPPPKSPSYKYTPPPPPPPPPPPQPPPPVISNQFPIPKLKSLKSQGKAPYKMPSATRHPPLPLRPKKSSSNRL